MPPPLPRFTLGRLMAGVALLAILMGAGAWCLRARQRALNFRYGAFRHGSMARACDRSADAYRSAIAGKPVFGPPPGDPREWPAYEARERTLMEYHLDRRRRFLRAAANALWTADEDLLHDPE